MTEPGVGASALDVAHRSSRLELSAPVAPEVLDLVHALLEHLWGAHDVGETERAMFETAVIEVLGNVVEHAFAADGGDGSGRRLEVVLSVSERDVVARVSDNGVPISLDLSGAVMPGELAESGRGLALAISALDSLAFRRAAGRNIWDLVLLRDLE